MNEAQIRAIVQNELGKQSSQSRFTLSNTASHKHTGLGTDGPQINQSSIIPNTRVMGRVEMAQQTTYRIGVNFNPTSVRASGLVTGPGGIRCMTVGSAELGSTFYMQPESTTSTIIGGPEQTVVQTAVYLSTLNLGASGAEFHTLASEGHIVSIEYGGHIYARATVMGYTNQHLIVLVDNLDAGWDIILNWTIT